MAHVLVVAAGSELDHVWAESRIRHPKCKRPFVISEVSRAFVLCRAFAKHRKTQLSLPKAVRWHLSPSTSIHTLVDATGQCPGSAAVTLDRVSH